MDWKRVAIEDLKKYEAQKTSLINISEKIVILGLKFESIKGATLTTVPVHGGGTQIEDKLLDNIVERERLKTTYKATKRLVHMVKRGLTGLQQDELTVLNAFFIDHNNGHVEKLMDRLGYEKSQIYNIKDKALYKFTITMYGLIDY